MDWKAAFTLGVLAVMIFGLIRYPQVIDVIFLGALGLFAAVGIIRPAEAFLGFANDGLLTIGALFVVAAGITETGLLHAVARRLLGRADSPRRAVGRVTPAVIGLSAFLNNTTVVAMGIPVLLDWCRHRRIAASRVLLPLSYAAVLGGVCTLIGTSTNLVVHGLMRSRGMSGFGMWELGLVGVPIALCGGLLLVILAPRLLPDRKEFLEQIGEARREFLVEMLLQPDSPLVGRTIQEAGLRHLQGLFLVEIERNAQRIAPVAPDERLARGDRLVFTGVVSTIVDLQRMPGLVPAADEHVAPGGRERGFYEVVISPSSPLVGQSIRDASFRTIYDAAVIAAHRNGERLRQKIGDIVLRPGDTLLLLTGPGFLRVHRNNPDFYLVSETAVISADRRGKAPLAAGIGLTLIALLTLPDILSVLAVGGGAADWLSERRTVFAFLAAGAMIVGRCVQTSTARRQIEWQILLVIGAALGISRALTNSGAADILATLIDRIGVSYGPMAVLAAIFIITTVLTELMSNNAAAALVFPIAMAAAADAHVNPQAFAVCVAVAASNCFILPIGYQTHLMVFGPGGYHSRDFVRIGLPMSLLWFTLSMLLIPVFWPLAGN